MKILIATGIYPPQIGGPAQYAKNVREEFMRQGHAISLLTYRLENKLPIGIRHILFFFRVLCCLRGVDFIVALDTFSVALPSMLAAGLLRKKIIIRTGGDFLWESYVERTKELVLLRKFYEEHKQPFSFKERAIFKLTRFVLQYATALVFSTEWQRDIFTSAYHLDTKKNYIIENFYAPKMGALLPTKKDFIAGARPLVWKNIPKLKQAFEKARKQKPELMLDDTNAPYERFLQKIRGSYAVILASLGDISPNMILDAIRCNKPFIMTRETGLYPKLKDVGLFVDPEDVNDIAEKIIFLSDEKNYEVYKKKVESFTFMHTWKDICSEFIEVYKKI